MNTVETGFTWRSQPVFVIVSVGAILSLNDFLTFPVLAGQNGGGAFLLLYILFLFTFSLPLLMTELMMGRMTRSDPTRSFAFLTREYRLCDCRLVVCIFCQIHGGRIRWSHARNGAAGFQ
jgi:NSS family neurotransmitter:Na+ symporter